MLIIIIVAIGIISLLFLIVGALLFKRKKEVALAFLGVGFALLCGDLLGLTAQVFSQKEVVKTIGTTVADGLLSLNEEQQIAVLEHAIGSRAVAGAVVEGVFKETVFYRDVNTEVEFYELGDRWPEDVRARLLGLNVVSKLVVENPGDRTIPYPLRVRFSDLTKPEAGEIECKKLIYTPLDEHGRPIEDKRKVWNRPPRTDYDSEIRQQIIAHDFQLDPHQSAIIELRLSGFERRAAGNYLLQTRHCADGMSLAVSFPDSTYSPMIYFSHRLQNDPDICIATGLRTARAMGQIVGGVLPFQGLIATWSKSGDMKEAVGVAEAEEDTTSNKKNG